MDDADFQDVYYEFYLSARWAVMNNPKNKEPYFVKLQNISPEDNLMDIIHDFKRILEKGSNELSLGSKLLHTRNPSSPIYDKKIREYLSENEDVNFWWQIPNKESGALRGTTEEEKIKHDWQELCNWYKRFLH